MVTAISKTGFGADGDGAKADEPQHHACPQCGTSLVIDWRGSHDWRMPEILGLEEKPIGSSDL